VVPEVPVVHVDASDEVRMIPLSPTATNNPLEVVVVLSVVVEEELVISFFAQEMTVKLKRKRERIMSRCFTWFPIGGYRRTLHIP
jgi:hypothetical protein